MTNFGYDGPVTEHEYGFVDQQHQVALMLWRSGRHDIEDFIMPCNDRPSMVFGHQYLMITTCFILKSKLMPSSFLAGCCNIRQVADNEIDWFISVRR